MNYLAKWMEEAHVIKGVNRECVYDNPRGEYYLVSNGFSELISSIEGKSRSEICSTLDDDELDWLTFAEEKELIAWVPESTYPNFTHVPSGFETPNFISNAIIEFGDLYLESLELLEELQCRHFEIILKDIEELKYVTTILNKDYTFQGIDIQLTSPDQNIDDILKILEGNTLIGNVVVPNLTDTINFNDSTSRIVQQKSNSSFTPMFISNEAVFFESESHNVFFNKKIYIKKNGDISIYKGVYPIGNIRETRGADVKDFISKDSVRTLWNVSKNEIDVCKQCEFRRMCIDNRVPKKRDQFPQSFYYETECSYNPYISLWKWDKGYRNLSETGIECGEEAFSLNYSTLENNRSNIWGEE